LTNTARSLAAVTAMALFAATVSPAFAQDAGQAQFLSSCSACHQPTGQGIKGAFPALAGDAFVQGEPSAVIGRVLNGRAGMPRFKGDLNDDQIAAVVTFIRSAWGNHASPVTPADVAAVRSGAAPAPMQTLQAH
jgi:mono/diheme cytochrome c family protein